MAKDDLTKKLPGNDEDRTTQPTLMAVFELVREVKDGLTAQGNQLTAQGNQLTAQGNQITQLSAQVTQLTAEVAELRADVGRLSARLDQVESRLSRDITGLGYKIEALNKSRLQTEADYSSLFDRVTVLESKIP